ncbi:hypothetical protein BH09MYX1_BH09MYX1_38510 [soil metagenome]
MPPLPWLLLSLALLLLPLVLAYFAARPGNGSFAAALFRVPVALAVDVVFISVLSAFVPLAIAAVAARVAYVVAFAMWRIGGAAKIEHDFRTVALAIAAGAITISASLELSWHFTIWDRQWHLPLVASLEGQTLPFANTLDAGRLHYHFGGDLIAAEARALSFDHLSSASALSLVHDAFIGLAVAWLVALCRALGARSLVVPALAAIALAWHGAIPRFVGVMGKDDPFFSFSQVSYRPHAPVSLLAGTMLIGALVSRMIAPRLRGARSAIVAGLLVASLCDEASVAIYGLAIGVTWVFFPRVLGRTRWRGVGFLFLLLVAVVVPNVFITGTIGHGGALRTVEWVAPRFAGMEGISTPLFSARGAIRGSMWLAAPLAALIALTLSRTAKRGGPPGSALVFVATTFFVGCTLALCLVVNGSAGEAQRFYLAPFVGPLVVLTLLTRDLRPSLKPFVGLAIGVPALLSVYADATIAAKLRFSEYTAGAHDVEMPYSLFDVDCADVAPTRLGEPTRRMYVDVTGYSLYSSCRSLWVPGQKHAGWGIEIFSETNSNRQRTTLERSLTGTSAPAACWNNRPSDAVCNDLKLRGLCTPSNRYFVDCTLPLDDHRAGQTTSSSR